jgi:outer membrane protein OmpA-like peptidoglycan-associated protein
LTACGFIEQLSRMSEVKQEEKAAEAHENAEHPQPEAANAKLAASINPVLILLFMILAMLIVLAVTVLRQSKAPGGNTSEDPTVAAIKADLQARRSELNRQRIAMGLAPLETGREPVEDIAKRLKADADTLAGISGKFQQMLAEKDAELSARNAETLRLEKLRQDISQENARLQNELQRALIVSAETERLKMMLADAQAQRDAIGRELATLKEEMAVLGAGVSEEEFAELQRRYEETLRSKDFYEARAKELEAKMAQADLFADSEAELMPAAVELFRRLRKLEGHKDSDLTTEYSKVGVDLGANVLHAMTFETGKSELSAADMEKLAAIAASEVPDGDLTLIIGYASETGNLDANQELSSRRATTAAEHFAKLKRPGQLVQAVYLGQTDRFSSRVPERNQICEVWRIRRK